MPLQNSLKSARLKSYPHLQLKIFNGIESVRHIWDSLILPENIFLSSAYLQVLEDAGPENLSYHYSILYDEDQPVGAIYCQTLPFHAAGSLNLNEPTHRVTGHKVLGRRFVKTLAHQVRFRALICGNVLVTGEHGYRFLRNRSKKEEADILAEALDCIRENCESEGEQVDVTLVKDFFTPHFLTTKSCFLKAAYHELSVQPNMIMEIPGDWTSVEDYLLAMKSKYRVRTRRARKFADRLERLELFQDQLTEHRDHMHFLYNEIADGADFNLFKLHKDYLVALKQAFPTEFRVFGYFKEGKLLGFSSTMRNGPEIEAHFLGYRQEVNREYQLYHNMLLDIVEQAINNRSERIVFARTALEIKSSVGARPEEMHCYIKHKSKVTNAFFPLIFGLLNPDSSWQQRHPFNGGDDSAEAGMEE